MTRAFNRCLLLLGGLLLAAVAVHAEDGLKEEFSSRQAIEKRLAAVIEERAQVSGERGDALQELESASRSHLATLDLLTVANNELTKAQQALENWQAFSNQAPYPIRFVDRLRENHALALFGKTACETQIRIVSAQLESARERLSRYQGTERNLEDQKASSQNPESVARLQESIELERIRSRIAAEEIGRFDLRLQAQRAEGKITEAKIQLAEIQLKAVEGKSSFTRSELDEIFHDLARQRKITTRANTTSTLSADPLSSWHIEFLDLQKAFWQARFDAFNSPDLTLRKASLSNFQQAKNRLNDWEEIAQLRLAIGTEGSAINLDPTLLRDALQQTRSFQRRIDFAIAELGGEETTIRSKLLARLKSGVLSIWQAELYLAEETDIIDGKKVSTYRAVTVGKILRLAAIITVGWLLLRWTSRLILSLLSRRAGVTPKAAHFTSKLFFGVGMALLITYGLTRVHIPFTAFAFMGGALAIGVGFGAQTMLKNFISGIILIFERPFKVGDIVQVDDINGRVQNIGLRASRIAHFDGIDTLVPNSYLLENSLTNWSFSSTLMRHNITVGVAYGSKTRDVAHILLNVANEHGNVFKEPAPEVRLSDFGDNSLVFNLYFWLDTNKSPRDPLASDLRFMIEKALSEAGIPISFPQRDLHFDPATPLRVEISRNSSRAKP